MLGGESPKTAYYQGLIANPDCKNCPLQNDVTVLPDGPIPAKIAFIGESPGTKEKAEGRGFVGPSGELLWLLAKQAGISREEVWVTNAMLCQPRKIKLVGGAILGEAAVQQIAYNCCRMRLLQELIYIKPTVIVPLGKWALKAVTSIDRPKVFSYRGSILQQSLPNLLESLQRRR